MPYDEICYQRMKDEKIKSALKELKQIVCEIENDI